MSDIPRRGKIKDNLHKGKIKDNLHKKHSNNPTQSILGIAHSPFRKPGI